MSRSDLAVNSLNAPCLCGSGQSYQACCYPYHAQTKYPQTAQKLMRARFVAYALHLKPYLLTTWCEITRPGETQLEFDDTISWQKLVIHKTTQGQAKMHEGWVSFSAYYQVGFEACVMHEKSYFKRTPQGSWCYVDGEVR